MDTLDKDGGLHPLGTWINPRIILFPDGASVRILRHLTPNGKHTGNEVVDIPAAADFR
jgi:hypothetical protein